MRRLDPGSLVRLDTQDVLALARGLDDSYRREVLAELTDTELNTAGDVVGLAIYRLTELERRIRATKLGRLTA